MHRSAVTSKCAVTRFLILFVATTMMLRYVYFEMSIRSRCFMLSRTVHAIRTCSGRSRNLAEIRIAEHQLGIPGLASILGMRGNEAAFTQLFITGKMTMFPAVTRKWLKESSQQMRYRSSVTVAY